MVFLYLIYFLIIIAAVVFIASLVGLILIIVSIVMKKKQKISFIIPLIIGIVFMLPILYMGVLYLIPS